MILVSRHGLPRRSGCSPRRLAPNSTRAVFLTFGAVFLFVVFDRLADCCLVVPCPLPRLGVLLATALAAGMAAFNLAIAALVTLWSVKRLARRGVEHDPVIHRWDDQSKFNPDFVEQPMFFSLGPVMRYELITTSRRRRYYFIRVIYGLLLLGQLWMLFRSVGSQPSDRGHD